MATSGETSVLRVSALGCEFYFSWSATQSQSGGTSTVTTRLYSRRYSSGGWFTGTVHKNRHTIDGTQSAILNATGVTSGSSTTTWTQQSSYSRTITHNQFGEKANFTASCNFYNTNGSYNETLSLTVSLTDIPRAVVWVGNASGVPVRGVVYVGNSSNVPVLAQEIWVGNASKVPVKGKTK